MHAQGASLTEWSEASATETVIVSPGRLRCPKIVWIKAWNKNMPPPSYIPCNSRAHDNKTSPSFSNVSKQRSIFSTCAKRKISPRKTSNCCNSKNNLRHLHHLRGHAPGSPCHEPALCFTDSPTHRSYTCTLGVSRTGPALGGSN